MSVRIDDTVSDGSILVGDLKQGVIAVITRWDRATWQVGKIVQISGSKLVDLGNATGWDLIPNEPGCRVRTLKNGTSLVVEDNE